MMKLKLEYWLGKLESSRIGVHFYNRAYWNDKLFRDMSDHRAVVGGNAQRKNVIIQDIVQGKGAITSGRSAITALAKDKSFDQAECTV